MQIDPTRAHTVLDAARHYRDDCGWIVHPLHGPKEGTEKEHGKKPRLTGWKKLDLFDCTDEWLAKHLGGSSTANLGVVVRLPHVVIDLDSKADGGKSVMDWITGHPEVAAWPRERTGGGCHLHLRCEDIPEEALEAAGRNQKLSSALGPGLTAEVFFGGNVAIAPSVHPSGHRYVWEVGGELPRVAWATLERLFLGRTASAAPAKTKPSPRERKELPFWAKYHGNLQSLDLVGLTEHLGIYGQPLGGDEGKHTIECPWRDQHSDSKSPWRPGDSSTVIWQGAPPSLPSCFCSHTSHGEKSLADLLAWAEAREAGVVDRFCREQRLYRPPDLSAAPPAGSADRPQIVLPGPGRLESDFAADVGRVMGRYKKWFRKAGLVVEIRKQEERIKVRVRDSRKGGKPEPIRVITFTGFALLKPNRAITSVEEFIEPGILVKAPGPEGAGLAMEFVPKSMKNAHAAVALESDELIRQLPEVERILDVPIPILDPETGKLTFPRPGHDPRFNTYLVETAPPLAEMPLEEAKALIRDLLKDFCFKTEQDLVHAVSALITPFCRGLFDRWTSRTPVYFYRANRPRAGKDYLAGVVALVYEGRTNEDAPLTSDVDETRKKITAALIAGRRRIHFSNCAGFIRNDVFEQIVTNERWSDRTLGSNQEVTIPNEIEFSLSGNTGVNYTPDFGARTRTIALHFEEEHENQRTFSNADLHGWVREHRSEILSAIWALVRHWDGCGRPAGPTPFTSFPSWAEVVGGVMRAADLGDPCLPDADTVQLGGDSETRDMKALYRLAYAKYPETWLAKKQVRELALTGGGEDGEPLFAWLELDSRSGQTRFGSMLEKHVGRVFEGVRMLKDTFSGDSSRQRLKFSMQTTRSTTTNIFAKVFGSLASVVTSLSPETTVGKTSSETSAGSPQSPADLANLADLFIPGRNLESAERERNEGMEEKEGVEDTEVGNTIGNGDGVEKVSKVRKVRIDEGWDFVTNSAVFGDIAEEIAIARTPLALDLETYGKDTLNPRRSDIRLLALALPDRKPWLLDLQRLGYRLGELHQVLERTELIIHNARFDLGFLAHHCGVHPEQVFCTLTAARLLTAGTRQRNGLADVLRRYGIADLQKGLGGSDWGAMLFDDQLAYAASDVVHLHSLRERLLADLTEASLTETWALEQAVLPVVVGMEEAGVKVDREHLERIRDEHRSKAAAEAKVVRQILGGTFNPSSPEQLKEALRAAGVPVSGTGEAVLAELVHPAVEPILAMRSAEKTAQQAQSLLEAVEADGRIHAGFDPTGTEAGRFSGRDPNLQNVARGELRECFVAPEGSVLVVADYSQIELRVVAALAGESRMIEAYRAGADLHRRTAALVLGKEEAAVTKEDRQLAKAVNFGLIYGQSAAGLVGYAKSSYGVTLTDSQAEAIRKKFFKAYRGMADWHARTRQEANQGMQETRTRLGRRRILPSGPEAFWPRFSGGLNTPVQGGAADGLKRALSLLPGRLPKGARIISTVHDEIIVECPDAQASAVKGILEEAMREGMAALYPEVPIEVEAHAGRTWAEAK